MKRELERTEELKPFDIGVGELKLVWNRMLEMFDHSERINCSIRLSLPSETLKFDSLAELTAYEDIKGRVTDFSVRMSQGDRVISLSAGGLFISRATVKVEGESDVWCAGAVEAVQGIVRNYTSWYSWFGRIPFFSMIFFLTTMLYSIQFFNPSLLKSLPQAAAYPMLSVFLTLLVLGFVKDKVAPRATITFSREVGLLREYSAEIGLALGIVSILISVVGVWVSVK